MMLRWEMFQWNKKRSDGLVYNLNHFPAATLYKIGVG